MTRVTQDARLDAVDKASGTTVYTADVTLEGMCHAAIVRSTVPHGRVLAVEATDAEALPGVIGVFSAEHVPPSTYGRGVRDVPILARGKVRFVGERVAVVVAETRQQAERAARSVDVRYEELPAVFEPAAALRPGAPAVHEAPWTYPRPTVPAGGPPNLQSHLAEGDEHATESRLAGATHVIDRTYTTPTGHQGYIEPQACVAHAGGGGSVRLWVTDKNPYRLREEVALCLGLDADALVVHPVALGGDFGGKGAYGDAALCVALARLVGRPVKLALRSWEDLAAGNPRHPARMRVRIGCDADGAIEALRIDVLCDGGAYAGFKPRPTGDIHGFFAAGSSYRIPEVFVEARIAYTNSVPRGHMRAPGSPQVTFAVESAIDELAAVAGVDPVEFRLRNVLADGDTNPHGVRWEEFRGRQVIEAARAATAGAPPAPPGWVTGAGLAVYDRATRGQVETSLRLCDDGDGRVRVEVPVPETGTGSHTIVRETAARRLGIGRDQVRVVHVPTSGLPHDRGAGGSRVTFALTAAVAEAVERWEGRGAEPAVSVDVRDPGGAGVTSVCVQVAHVAVEPETGQFRVLEIVTVVDVAEILRPAAHRAQLDGGTVMGFGFACLEDLRVEDGQVWAGTLASFTLPSSRDVPGLRTVLVPGGKGAGAFDLKSVGELSNVPTAAAIANAVADATGVRVRSLPIRAEQLWEALACGS